MINNILMTSEIKPFLRLGHHTINKSNIISISNYSKKINAGILGLNSETVLYYEIVTTANIHDDNIHGNIFEIMQTNKENYDKVTKFINNNAE